MFDKYLWIIFGDIQEHIACPTLQFFIKLMYTCDGKLVGSGVHPGLCLTPGPLEAFVPRCALCLSEL